MHGEVQPHLCPPSPVLLFLQQKEDWTLPASPDLPRPPILHPLTPDLFYLIDCPPHKDTPMASILQREPADHGRFLNHIEFVQGSETDARFEPKAVCL